MCVSLLARLAATPNPGLLPVLEVFRIAQAVNKYCDTFRNQKACSSLWPGIFARRPTRRARFKSQSNRARAPAGVQICGSIQALYVLFLSRGHLV